MRSAGQSDADLVRRAQSGDLDAYASVVRMHESRLRTVLFRVLDDPRDVEETVQDAFVQAWRNLASYRSDAAFFTWLYRIGMNTALARRRRKEHPIVDLELLDSQGGSAAYDASPGPESVAEARAERSRIVEALAALEFEYREAVVLRDIAGLSNTEVAEALGVSLAAAKSRIHRGRLQLRGHLEPHDDA